MLNVEFNISHHDNAGDFIMLIREFHSLILRIINQQQLIVLDDDGSINLMEFSIQLNMPSVQNKVG